MVFFPPLLRPFLLISSPRKKNMDIFHVIYDKKFTEPTFCKYFVAFGKKTPFWEAYEEK